MNAEAIKFLYDILDGISKIKFHIQNINSSVEFIQNVTVTDAVERRLAIIGEALWKASKIDKSINVSDQKSIISLRHIIIHEYDMIDKGTLWRIIQNNLPVLQSEIEQILKSLEEL
jgi:uncharacterized protein with HEPN domain